MSEERGPVKLGKLYRDKHSGFEGMASARSEFLYGCVRVVLEGKEGDKNVELVFDEQRLVDVETEQPVETTAEHGGNQAVPSQTGLRR